MLTIMENLLGIKSLLNSCPESSPSLAITTNPQKNWFPPALKKYHLHFQPNQRMRLIRSPSISSLSAPSHMHKPQKSSICKSSNQILTLMRSSRLRTCSLLLMLIKLTKFRKLSMLLLNPSLAFK